MARNCSFNLDKNVVYLICVHKTVTAGLGEKLLLVSLQYPMSDRPTSTIPCNFTTVENLMK